MSEPSAARQAVEPKDWCGKSLGSFAGNEVECNRPKGHDGACDHCFEIKGEVTWEEAKQILAADVSRKPTN